MNRGLSETTHRQHAADQDMPDHRELFRPIPNDVIQIKAAGHQSPQWPMALDRKPGWDLIEVASIAVIVLGLVVIVYLIFYTTSN